MSAKPFKLQTIRPEYLEGEPHAIINSSGDCIATVMVNPKRKMWGVIQHRSATTGEFFRMKPVEINSKGWAVWKWSSIPTGESKDPFRFGSQFIVRDEAARDFVMAKCAAAYQKWIDGLRASMEAECRAFIARQEHDPEPFRLFTVAECRQHLQRNHPDRGGNADTFDLWKTRLDHAKQNARTV